jgi:2-polyprenyl-6-methoxyphenol hydroxylase-like FAD-dependent oxidoreductase
MLDEHRNTPHPRAPAATPPDRWPPVAISGAGPVGLALALGLARTGIRSVIIEKKTHLDPHYGVTVDGRLVDSVECI